MAELKVTRSLEKTRGILENIGGFGDKSGLQRAAWLPSLASQGGAYQLWLPSLSSHSYVFLGLCAHPPLLFPFDSPCFSNLLGNSGAMLGKPLGFLGELWSQAQENSRNLQWFFGFLQLGGEISTYQSTFLATPGHFYVGVWGFQLARLG